MTNLSISLSGRIPFVNLNINKLNLPIEIINLIKEFLFYELDNWIKIKQIREKKAYIIFPFKFSRHSLDNLPGFWIFIYAFEPNPFDFRAQNCIKCGNYKKSEIYHRFLPNSAKCLCNIYNLKQLEVERSIKKINRRNNIKTLINSPNYPMNMPELN